MGFVASYNANQQESCFSKAHAVVSLPSFFSRFTLCVSYFVGRAVRSEATRAVLDSYYSVSLLFFRYCFSLSVSPFSSLLKDNFACHVPRNNLGTVFSCNQIVSSCTCLRCWSVNSLARGGGGGGGGGARVSKPYVKLNVVEFFGSSDSCLFVGSVSSCAFCSIIGLVAVFSIVFPIVTSFSGFSNL